MSVTTSLLLAVDFSTEVRMVLLQKLADIE